MPMQQQNSSFAKRMGGRVAQANAEHKDKPVDTGNRRLPGGIRDGIAKLSAMYTKEQTEEGGKTPKGETFFRASAIVVAPQEHDGEKVAGIPTQVIIPLCDVPAKDKRKAESFSDNWYEFQNLFKLLGIVPPTETPQTDPTGQKTEAYYFAAMKTLTDPQRPPVYISFSTRAWTPPATQQQPKPQEMVFETWHGLADPQRVAQLNGQFNPAAGVTVGPPNTTPQTQAQRPFNEFAQPPSTNHQSQAQLPESGKYDVTTVNMEDEVTALVEVAIGDPDGATEDGQNASARLEQLAWAAGWTKEQTVGAVDWAQVGEMALNPPQAVQNAAPTAISQPPAITIGSKWKFCKRTKEGAKLRNNKGEEFPPRDVEVVTIDPNAQTCTVMDGGKPVIDIRSKQPIAVKFEWLEPL